MGVGRCRSYWHAQPHKSLERVARHYRKGPMRHCGPYQVCVKHPTRAGKCRTCGFGFFTGRTFYHDPNITEYEIRCSANSYPYRYTVS